MNTTIHHILQELETALMAASSDEAVQITGRSIDQLQGYMRLYTFRSTAEEVLYFKVFKPRFIAHRLYAEWVYKQLRTHPWVEHTFEQQAFYEYYISGHSQRDGFYFTERHCNKLDFEVADLKQEQGRP